MHGTCTLDLAPSSNALVRSVFGHSTSRSAGELKFQRCVCVPSFDQVERDWMLDAPKPNDTVLRVCQQGFRLRTHAGVATLEN